MIAQEDIVCISTSEWDFLWTRKQRLMARLAKQGNRVLYVDPAYASRSERLGPKKGYRVAYGTHVRQVSESLWVMTPPLSLPFGRFHWSRNLSDRWLAKEIREFLAEQRFRLPILWIYWPITIALLERIPYKLLIYEAVDDIAEYPTFDAAMRRFIRECETEIVKRADLVFVTSPELLKRRAELNPNIFVSSNGVDVQLFSTAQDPTVDVPNDLRGLPRPILGFIGGIAPWTDLDLAIEVALRKPNWSIVLIGPVDSGIDIERFNGVKNVHFFGRRPPELLPSYLKGIDVCLNLFKRTPLTQAVNPLKVYEYLAAGKPVVSTPMPEVEKFGEMVSVADSPDAFVDEIERAIACRAHPEQIKRRVEAVGPYSWDAIFDQAMAQVDRQLQKVAGRSPSGGRRGT